VLTVGSPGTPLLDIPVSQGRVGLIVAAGLNPIAAVEEQGVPTENHAMETLCEFAELRPVAGP
jgi:repressor of nif and glnA expression